MRPRERTSESAVSWTAAGTPERTLPVPDPTLEATSKPQVSGAAPDDAALPLTGKHRYTIARELGRGSQSVVLLALDAAVGREVAFKMVHDATQDPAFVREARITGQLEHPGIVPVYEIGRDDRGQHYCTQKLVRGRSLGSALAACTTAAARLALLPHLVDVCNAVAYAHSRSVVHRDLKPENVMVGEFGETVVLDWGIAKVLDGSVETVERPLSGLSPGQTQQGALMGTPLYLSPEQAAGNAAGVDRRSDVWSLGVMLYELVAGRPPFFEATLEALLAKVRTGVHQPLTQAAPGVSPELAAIVEKALEKEPANRFPDAAALAKELAAFRAGGRLSVYQYSSWELVRRFVARNRALTTVAAVALVAVVGAGAVAFGNYRRAEANLKQARQRLAGELIARARHAESELDWNEALALYRRSLDAEDSQVARWGIGLLSTYETPARLVHQLDAGLIWSASFDAAQTRVLVSTPDLVAVFSSKGAALGSWPGAKGGTLSANGESALLLGRPATLVAVSGGAVAALEGHPDAIAAAFRPGHAAVALARSSGAVELFDVASGSRLTELPGAPGRCDSLAFSQDGRLLGCPTPEGHVAVWDVDSARRSHLFKTQVFPYQLLFDGTHRLLVGDQDRFIQVLPLDDDAPVQTLVGHRRSVNALTQGPGQRYLASSSADGTVMIWSGTTLRPLMRLSAEAAGLHFATDGSSLDAVTLTGERLSWNLASLPRIVAVAAPGVFPLGVFSADGRSLAWCSPQRIGLTSLETGATLFRDGGCQSVAAAPNGKDLAVAIPGRGLVLLDAITLEERSALDAGTEVKRLAWSGDGGTLWFTSAGSLRGWSATSGALDTRFEPDAGNPYTLAFSPDGQRVAWAEGSRVVLSVDGRRELLDEHEVVTSLAFSFDGSTVAVGTHSGVVLLLDGQTGALRCRATGHSSVARDLTFSRDGRVLVTASFDLSVRLWNTQSCEALGRLPALHHEALVVAWSPAGTQLVVGDSMGNLTVFDVAVPP